VFTPTMLDADSHDPFASTLIPVDRMVRKLIGFDQEVFYPWSAGIEKGADKDGAFRNKFAQTLPEALTDLCTGYANLARLATMTATVTSDPSIALMAFKYRGLAYESMRKSIAERGDVADELAMLQIFSLMSMEVSMALKN
jgi:hypothetical protein